MYEFVDLSGTSTDIIHELVSGLKSDPKYIPGYFIYDERGSKLFDRICELPEYYLTRTELTILERHAHDMMMPYKEDTTLVELGSGNSYKIQLLLDGLLKRRNRVRYVPIDISEEALRDTSRQLCENYPEIEVTACCGEYFDCLHYLDRFNGRKLIAWLGSSVGNFSKESAAVFLKRLKATLRKGDGLLIGIDLKKDPKTVERAYNDSEGVTSQYHLNALHRFNRELGADFKVENFQHRSFYDHARGTVEAFIISRCDQKVCVKDLDLEISFEKDEKVFNELSCKYDISEIQTLANRSGLSINGQWSDDNGDFAVVLFKV